LQQVGDIKQREMLIDRGLKQLSLRRQCELLGVKRGRIYHKPKAETELNCELMRVMDKHLQEHPTEGVQSMVYNLAEKGYRVNPKRIRRLFKVMGHETLYRVRNLTKQGIKSYIRPYLLRGMKINRANQVWSTDITYIPMRRGFMYLTAVMDVYSRKRLASSLSNTMAAEWCVNVVTDAISKNGKPEIINTDQGSQYTSKIWTEYMENQQKIKISMDGKGRATDKTWIERFWKTIKVNYIYLNPAEIGKQLNSGINKFIEYYNSKTHHTTKQKPNERYNDTLSFVAA